MSLGVPAGEVRPLRIFLAGAGSLGRVFLQQLQTRGVPAQVVALMTGHRGGLIAPDGMSPGEVLDRIELRDLDPGVTDFRAALRASEADVLVECVPQNIRSGEPALTMMKAAFDAGMDVVTSNKTPVALGFRDLQHRAHRASREFRFEATVLDGLPIFLWMEQLANEEVRRFRGVLNATSSAVFDAVASGNTRSRGLARAQAQGIAEGDSVLDLDGWDAAAKVALLTNVWMDGSLRVTDVGRKGLETVDDKVIRKAAEEGAFYRLVAEAERRPNGQVLAGVAPERIGPEHPFWPLRGRTAGTLMVEFASGRSLQWTQMSSGLLDAADGMLSDLRVLLRRRAADTPTYHPPLTASGQAS